MELYQLEYFLEAAKHRNFTRAATRLNLAQAALSEQMRKLEAEMGTDLFHRSRREMRLTAAGELLHRHAEKLLAQAAQARQAVNDLVRLRGGRLVIAAIPSVGACLLPAYFAAFRKRCPLVEVALLEGTSEEVSRWVEDGRVELGIVQTPATGGTFEETLLLEEAFCLLVSRSHPLARMKRVDLGTLSGEGFIFYKGRARDAAHAACRDAGLEPRVVCESGELETVRALVAAEVGIALLPALATKRLNQDFAVVQLNGEPLRRRVVLLQRKGQALSPSAGAFRRLLGSKGR